MTNQTSKTYNAVEATIAERKAEARSLIAQIEAQLDAMPDDTNNWAIAGDVGHKVAMLRVVAGYEA